MALDLGRPGQHDTRIRSAALPLPLQSRVPPTAFLAPILIIAGCAGTPFPPWTWGDVGQAARKAVTSPLVLVPAAAALLWSIDDWDERTAAWAVEQTPVFGSQKTASDVSSDLRSASAYAMLVAFAATPTSRCGSWTWEDKLWEAGLGASAVAATNWSTVGLQEAIHRTRPNERNDMSFPSAHASRTAVTSTLTLRYVDHWPLPQWGRWAAKGAFIGLPYAVGWARVESEHHFPSDVLAGVALGNLFAVFANELLDRRIRAVASVDASVNVSVGPNGDEALLNLVLSY